MTAPLLDLVIAVHSTERPIRRAVASALDSADPGTVRVTVVCHELATAAIAPLLDGLWAEDVRLIHFSDGVRSPAGPMNAGLACAEAKYVAVMGSDDFFEPDALRSYFAAVDTENPDVLIMPLRHQGGELLRNPLVRFRRRRRLDVVRDRLFYRSSPLALIRRTVVERLAEPFTTGLPAGVDLALSSWLWTRPVRIDFPATAPAYVIGDDAADRVTLAPRPARVAMEPLRRLLDEEWVIGLPGAVRMSLAIKTLRIHVLGAVRARPLPELWSAGDLSAVRAVCEQTLELAPTAFDPFSQADRAILEAIVAASSDDPRGLIDAMDAAGRSHRRHSILPKRLMHALDRESTLTRFMLYRLDRWEAR